MNLEKPESTTSESRNQANNLNGGDGLVRPKKRGNRITKWRDANTGGCVSVSSDQESRGGKGEIQMPSWSQIMLSIGVCVQIYSVKDLSHRVSWCSRV